MAEMACAAPRQETKSGLEVASRGVEAAGVLSLHIVPNGVWATISVYPEYVSHGWMANGLIRDQDSFRMARKFFMYEVCCGREDVQRFDLPNMSHKHHSNRAQKSSAEQRRGRE
jgi:hypothetical protein